MSVRGKLSEEAAEYSKDDIGVEGNNSHSSCIKRVKRTLNGLQVGLSRSSSNDELESPMRKQQQHQNQNQKKQRACVKVDEELESNLIDLEGLEENRPRSRSQKKSLRTQMKPLETRYMLDLSVQEDITLLHRAVQAKKKSAIVLSLLKRSLSQLAIFKSIETNLSAERYTDLLQALSFKAVMKGSAVYSSGESATQYYFLVKGSVCVMFRSTTIINEDPEQQVENQNPSKKHQTKQQQRTKTQESLLMLASTMDVKHDFDRLSTPMSVDSKNHKDWLKRRFPHFQEVGEHFSGEGFGELSILRGGKRQATVIAKEECVMLVLSRENFMGCLGELYEKQYNEKVAFILRFFFFTSLEERLQLLMNLFERKVFSAGQKVYSVGDEVDSLYLLRTGSVSISASQQGKLSQEVEEEYDSLSSIDGGNRRNQQGQSCSPFQQPEVDAKIVAMTRQTSKSMESKKPATIAVLTDGAFFGEDEIIDEQYTHRMHSAIVTSTRVEVLRVTVKNLKIIARLNDVMEKLKIAAATKFTWRTHYTYRCKQAIKIHQRRRGGAGRSTNCEEQSEEVADNGLSLLMSKAHRIPRELTSSILNRRQVFQNQQQAQQTRQGSQKEQAEAAEEGFPPHLLLSLIGEESKLAVEEGDDICTVDISCRDSCLKESRSTGSTSPTKAKFLTAKRKAFYVKLNKKARQADSDARLAIGYHGANWSPSDEKKDQPGIQYSNVFDQSACFVSQPGQIDLNSARESSSVDKLKLGAAHNIEESSQLMNQNRMKSTSDQHAPLKEERRNVQVQELLEKNREKTQVAGMSQGGEGDRSDKSPSQMLLNSSHLDYRSIHSIFIDIGNSATNKKVDKFRKQYQNAETQFMNRSKRDFIIPSYDAINSDPMIVRLISRNQSLEKRISSKSHLIPQIHFTELEEDSLQAVEEQAEQLHQNLKATSRLGEESGGHHLSSRLSLQSETDELRISSKFIRQAKGKQQLTTMNTSAYSNKNRRNMSTPNRFAATARLTQMSILSDTLRKRQTEEEEVGLESTPLPSSQIDQREVSPLKNFTLLARHQPHSVQPLQTRLISLRKTNAFEEEQPPRMSTRKNDYIMKDNEQKQQKQQLQLQSQEKYDEYRRLSKAMKRLNISDSIFGGAQVSKPDKQAYNNDSKIHWQSSRTRANSLFSTQSNTPRGSAKVISFSSVNRPKRVLQIIGDKEEHPHHKVMQHPILSHQTPSIPIKRISQRF